jgi:hypothetical membrane protein
VLCSLAAILQYPGSYNPLDNWISDMGSYEKNPSGAIIYNVGAGIAGLLLFPFFIGLASWYYLAKNSKYLYVGAEIFGFIAALGMIMHGVFQEGTSLHFLWASVCFGALVVVMVLANTALLKNPKFYKPLGYYGYAAAVFGLVFFALFVGIKDTPKIMEWIAAYTGFLWVWLFSLNALRPVNDKSENNLTA